MSETITTDEIDAVLMENAIQRERALIVLGSASTAALLEGFGGRGTFVTDGEEEYELPASIS